MIIEQSLGRPGSPPPRLSSSRPRVAFNSLLMVLEIQHTYWFVFIVQKVQLKFSIRVIGRYDTDLTED